MSNELPVTGVADAVLIDVLLGIGVRIGELMTLSREERLELLRAAAAERRIPADQAERLRTLDLLPAEPPDPG